MDIPLSGINVIIWDIDGTLYPFNEESSGAILESAYISIGEYMHWPRHKVLEEFNKVFEKITPSSTEAVSLICNVPIAEAAVKTDTHLNRPRFIKRDEKLITLFEQLSGFRHFILGNGSKKHITAGLVTLGLSPRIFDEIVTSEIVGVNKPEDNGFLYIMEKTGLPPNQHLMVGDREKVDLVPAKKLGIRTCLVWSVKPGMIADITLPSVYELSQVLI
jgi:FMN phosphatase YigB (HAD superfamily)